MNQKVLKTLEYYKIIERLTDCAASEPGKKMCRELIPSSDFNEIVQAQTETADAVTRVRQKGSLSLAGVRDVRDSLKRLEIGSSLSIMELLSVSGLLTCAARAKNYGRHPENTELPDDSLDEMFRTLEPLTNVNSEITRCILGEDEIADDASPGLHHVRRQMKITADKVHTQLNAILNSSRTMLQDAVITMRDGRYCLPVRAEYKSQFAGMVHDQSSTGSTLFIEPMAIIKLNNELRELELKEQKEIEMILAALSTELVPYIEPITTDFEILTKLDFIFAKAALARIYNCSMPKFNRKGYIHIKDGRHPLLDPKKVVPINIWMGRDFDLLIVTGPNTGGKTVSLKTVGLFTLMGQSGLQIPAFDGSELSVFDEVFADIGDEQSIEQSLSTFSSHMTNIARILRTADEKSLIMLDELCSGTDPVEGSALAVSILDEFRKRDCKVIATTHYQEVKMYAIKTDNVENASCEFDIKTLRPTYRVIVGMPGKSNAFAISSKLGISGDIIDNAKELVSTEDKRFEEVVQSLEKTRQELEKLKNSAAAEQKKSKEITEQLRAERDQLEKDKEKELQDVRSKAASIIEEVRFQGDLMLEELKRLRKQKESADFAQKVKGARSHINSSVNAMYDTANPIMQKKIDHYVLPRPLKVGDTVRLADLNKEGTLLRLPDSKNMCFVQVGAMKTKTKLENLRLVEEKKESKKQPTPSKVGKKLVSNFSRKSGMELDIRGMLGDDGVMEVDRFIDSCLLSGISVITIIHGKGTGALRSAVQQYLRKNPHVKSFRDGAYGEGEAGVTVAELE